MIYRQTLTIGGLIGAAIFILSTPLTIFLVAQSSQQFGRYAQMGLSDRAADALMSPWIFLILSAMPFLGLTMLIVGREYVAEKE